MISEHIKIRKEEGVSDFAHQPHWRNERHIVTDFRGAEGQTRYYVVASNLDLDVDVYEEGLSSMGMLD